MSNNKRKLEALGLVDKRLKNMSFLPPNIDTSQQKPPPVPQRPRNQNEAMGMASITVQPSEEDIVTFSMFTGQDRGTAVKYLRAKGNLEAAVNASLEGEDVSGHLMGPHQQTSGQDDRSWDDSVFGKGKDYDGLIANGAPSRAPSRNSMHPTSKDEEDADVEAAIRASMGQQTTGTIGANGMETRTMGPQPNTHYDKNNMQMVLHPTHSSSEMIPDTEAEDRRVGETGEPRFLKHVSDAEYLAPFLTVCHAIAGVREAMLMRAAVLYNYGQDAEWWKGHAIHMPKIVHTDSGEAAESETDKFGEVLAECQRLMAFLDASSRSYASVAPVRGMLPESIQGDSVLGRFISSWIKAASKYVGERRASNYFKTTVCSAKDDEEVGQHEVFDLTSTADKDGKQELTELLDLALWRFNEPDASFYVGHPADVIAIKVRNQDRNAEVTNVEVPTEFYIDKYLKVHFGATEPVRENIRKGKARLSKIESVEKKLRRMVPSGKTAEVNALHVLKSAKTYFAESAQEKKETTMTNGGLTNGVHPTEDDAMERDHASHGSKRYQIIAEKLDKLIVDVNKKLEVLAAEKEKTLKAIRDATHTPLPETVTKDFKHRYILRGVSTKPNTTYVLRPKPDDEDEEMLLDGAHETADKDDKTPEGMQWWRIDYDVTGSKAKITKSRHADYEVTQAVALEYKEALLIYASEAVNDTIHENVLLPEALQEFVKVDNALFDQELEEAERRRERERERNPPAFNFDSWDGLSGGGNGDVRTSIEPKEGLSRSGSMEHMEVSELGNGGGDGGDVVTGEDLPPPPEYEGEGFEGRDGFGLAPAKVGFKSSQEQVQVQGSYNRSSMEDTGVVHDIRLDEGAEGAEGAREGKSHVEDMEGME